MSPPHLFGRVLNVRCNLGHRKAVAGGREGLRGEAEGASHRHVADVRPSRPRAFGAAYDVHLLPLGKDKIQGEELR